MPDDARLARIEVQLSQINDAIVALARMEERMITLFKRMDTLDAEQNGHSLRIALVESKVGSNGQSLRFAERVFWIVVTAGVALAFAKIRGL